ncbi:MAG TPA: hypothetical protein VF613_13355 [Longimicrobium sp.]
MFLARVRIDTGQPDSGQHLLPALPGSTVLHTRTPMRLFIVALVLVLAGCASSGAGMSPRHSSTEISEAEVRASNQQNAYDVVQALRPGWLIKQVGTLTTGRGPEAPSDAISAYVDGQRLGTVDALRSISAMEVASVRRYDGVTAQQRFGLGNVNGVVEIITRRGSR